LPVSTADRSLTAYATQARAAQPVARRSVDTSIHTVGAGQGPPATRMTVELVWALTLVVMRVMIG
jgi:hypothetical protein